MAIFAKQQLIDQLRQNAAWTRQFHRKKNMVPNYIATTPTNSLHNMMYYVNNQTTVTTTPFWVTQTIASTANFTTIPSTTVVWPTTQDDLMYPAEIDSETYALNSVVDFLNRNCMTVSEFASKAFGDKALTLAPGTYKLPGGATLTIDDQHNYTIDDSTAKVIYAVSPHREFNEFVNVSDILDRFMAYLADLKLNKDDFLELPMRLFLLWLVIEAAKKDREPVPQAEAAQLELALEPLKIRALTHEVNLNVSSPAKVAHVVTE
jgi:hypothetical protein